MSKTLKQIRIEGNTAFVPLTRGLEALIDARDAHLVAGHNWHAVPSGHTFYAGRNQRIGDKVHTVKMHRVLMDARGSAVIDHVNQNGLDNRRVNLREATLGQNQHNRKKQKSSSRYKGVMLRKDSGKWQARIMVDGKHIQLGCYASEEDARAAYEVASEILHGDFGRTA
ncbi:MAG: hypothetical protein ACK5X3_12605 [Pseudomonadota bacterium]